MHPPPPGGKLAGGTAAERLEFGRKGVWGGKLGKERRGPVPQCGDPVSGCLTRGAGGQMTLDLHALRPAQTLVEIGVQLVLRNVPHGSL